MLKNGPVGKGVKVPFIEMVKDVSSGNEWSVPPVKDGVVDRVSFTGRRVHRRQIRTQVLQTEAAAFR